MGLVFFYVIRLNRTHFLSGNAIDKEDAVQVINLMLQDTGIPAFSLDANLFSSGIAPFDAYGGGARYIIAYIPRDAEAALGAQELFSLRLMISGLTIATC